MVKVELYFNKTIYDLSDHVEVKSIEISTTGDRTMDNGSFSITDIVDNIFSGLDMSRPLPRNARVRIDLVGDVYNLIIESDNVKRIADTNRYEHIVKLVSPSKLMMDVSTAALTVTQPQGDISLYYRTVSKYDNPSEMMVLDHYVNIPYTLRSNSIDPNVVDGMVIKGNRRVKIDVSITFRNYTHAPAVNYAPPVNLKIKIGSYEEVHVVRPDSQTFWKWLGFGETWSTRNIAIEYDNVGDNTVSVEMMSPNITTDTVLAVAESTLKIYTSDQETMDTIMLDYVVEKLLNNEMNKQQFFLDYNSKSLLSTYRSYEWTIPESYLWLQVIRIADYIKAFPRVYFESDDVNSRLMLELAPFDDLAFEQSPPTPDIEQAEASIDDYTSSLEINAKNVYSDTIAIYEETTLRVDGENAQITTDNLIIPTQHRIGKIYRIEYRIDKEIRVPSNNNFLPNHVFTLNNAVFDKRYYDTLSTESDYSLTGRQSYNQNNTLYYVEGEKHIRGCSNLGGRARPSSWNVNNYSRSIYEVALSYIARQFDENPYNIDEGLVADDNTIRIGIIYAPYVETNAVIFKEDQSGFEFKTRKMLNENMSINAPDIIGSYAQGIANRTGGTKYSFSGTTTPSILPNVLTTYNGMVLFTKNIKMLDDETCSYMLYYIKDYVFISSYESYDKKERIYQVSKDNIVERVIKKNNLLILSENNIPGNDDNYQRNVTDFFKSLTGVDNAFEFPRYAYIRAINSIGEIEVALPISYQIFARTIEYRVKFKDNYSAGLQKYVNGGNWYQKDYSYTNAFGRVEDISIQFYKKLPVSTVALFNELPKAPVFNQEDLMFNFWYPNLRKDAREIPVFSFQYSFLSESGNIIVYDDIASYCKLVYKQVTVRNYEIKTAELDYIPLRNAKYVDLTRITPLPNGSTTVSGVGSQGQINITSNNAKPIVIYNSNTLEILLVDKRALTNRTIYVRSDVTTEKVSYRWEKVAYIGSPYDYNISINGDLPLPTQSGLRLRKVTSITNTLTWRPTLMTTPNGGDASIGEICSLQGALEGDRVGFDDGSGNIKYPLRRCELYGTTQTYDYYVSVIDE